MNFVKYISSRRVSELKLNLWKFKKSTLTQKNFKKLVECLKKKIKKDSIQFDHLQSCLATRDEILYRVYFGYLLGISN